MSVDNRVGRASATPGRRLTTPPPPSPLPLVVAGGLGGLGAAALSLVTIGAPVLAGWMLVPDGSSSLSQMLQVTGGAWLAGQGLPVYVGDVQVSLLPLGIGIICLFFLFLAARWATRASAVARMGEAMAVAGSAAIAYGVAAAVTAALSRIVAVPPARAWLTCMVIAFAVCALASLSMTGLLKHLTAGISARVRDYVAAGVSGAISLLMVGALALALSLIVHAPHIGAVMGALHLDSGGAVMMTALSLVYLPTAIVWATAYVLGPGIAMGAGHVLSPMSATPSSTLPGFPLLTAIPADLPTYAAGLPLVMIGAGVVAGLVLRRRDYVGLDGLWASLAAGAIAGVITAGLAFICSGALGVEQLAHVGPPVLLCGAMGFATVSVGAVLTTLWRPTDAEDPADG